MHADRRIGGARAARDHANAGPAGKLAVRLSHKGCATFLAASDELDLISPGMQAVKHCQVAFARYAEGMRHALGNQAIDKKVTSELGFCHALIVQWRAGVDSSSRNLCLTLIVYI